MDTPDLPPIRKLSAEAREVVIHHGTPMTPREALLAVLPGRAAVVSFRSAGRCRCGRGELPEGHVGQWRVFILAGGSQARRGMGRRAARSYGALRLAGAEAAAWLLGGHTGSARRAQPAQRCTTEGLAVRPALWRPPLAYGRPAGSPRAALRGLRPRGAGLDRRPEERAGRLSALPGADARSGQASRQSLAGNPHDARGSGGLRLPLRQRRQHQPCAERTPL